ncbi:MAG: oligopeptide transporter, OPT family [Lachnospiraceae bacterium]|nr:oligopeptide transporter, OPT family [Lachnospiraceae bacterium]
MSEKKEEFRPYIPAEKITSEFTFTSIFMGIILAVVFGAANAYLGLRVGMTVSASIPAAVISMGVIRVIMRKDSILESNMVQTVGSAGESLAAGVIFTMPALFLWAKEGVTETPSMISITLIALCGGMLGVLFMIPLRNALIVKEHGVLPYPEGTACAEVLLAGEEGGSSAMSVFMGMGLAAVFKFLVDGFKVIPGVVSANIKSLKTELSAEVYPALIGVGYICGPKISSYMLAGGILGWFVFIPAIATFGADTIIYPGTDTIMNIYAENGASALWSYYIRYIGAGMVAAGGIISLIKSMPLIVKTFTGAMKGIKNAGGEGVKRTDQDMNMKVVICGVAGIILLIWLLPQIPVSLVGAILIALFGFFFGAVSSRMVGLVGSSNNPVSGMSIATLLFATLVLKISGDIGAHGMIGAISIGTVICIIAAMAGDTSQDLKTGYILGATPKKQQIGELIGAFVAALTIGGVLILLDKAWGFGTTELAAPQATLMKMIVEGVMDGNLPWTLVFIGIFTAVVVEILGIPVLPVAIGLYLPLELSTTIMLGGIIRWFADRKSNSKSDEAGSGVLFCSGMIAGEGLVGIILAVLAVIGIDSKIDLSESVNLGTIGGIILLAVMIGCVAYFAMQMKALNTNEKEKSEE